MSTYIVQPLPWETFIVFYKKGFCEKKFRREVLRVGTPKVPQSDYNLLICFIPLKRIFPKKNIPLMKV